MGTVRGDKRKLRNDRERAERLMVEAIASDHDAVLDAATAAFARSFQKMPPSAWVEQDDRAAMTWSVYFEESHGYPVLVGRGLPFAQAMKEARTFDLSADKRRRGFVPGPEFDAFAPRRDLSPHDEFSRD